MFLVISLPEANKCPGLKSHEDPNPCKTSNAPLSDFFLYIIDYMLFECYKIQISA